MRTCRTVILTIVALVAGATQLDAQVAASGHVGTLGLGADVAVGVGSAIALRGGVNFQPWEPSRTFDEVDFTLNLPSPSLTAVVDLYFAGPLRATGGLVWFGSNIELTGDLTQSVEIGNGTYTPQQVGTLSGLLETRDIAPYLGIGLGKKPGVGGVGFVLDLGVAMQGEPDVRLSASGALASDPSFQADLAREEQNIQDDASLIRFYPVISIGFVIGF